MNTVLTEFEPGAVENIKVGTGREERRLVAGVDYSTACAILEASPEGHEGIPAENGAFSLQLNPKTFELPGIGGTAKVRNDYVDPDSVCIRYASAAVADVEAWDWLKLRIQGGEFDGISVLGVRHDSHEAVLVLIDL